MGSSVAVVTDSSACLPAERPDRHGLIVVPLQVAIDGDARDETEFTVDRTVRALRERRPLTTSRPSPERFARAYATAAGAGASAVVSVHLSSALSGTVAAARLAAETAPVPVHVVDTGTVGMGVGFAALTAAAVARSGGGAAAAADAALRRAELTRSLLCVDTLEHLRRGGRIGAAPSPDPVLPVKSLLCIAGGRVAPLDKVRTASQALAAMADLAAEAAGDREVDLGVQHLAAALRAEALAARLRARVRRVRGLCIGEVGPAVGAHTGPGMVGVVVSPRPS
ncbi:DegV family protein [Thermomonospora catenispora]|uniref:DegV family protein n=1 Tax=Thermomonospora catenispora TaxID=2493090 RepID=UPI0011201858|nr:DegV family protein [Thermomonospora catenispora]TNY35030.1 DegV family EDD domain-containing protein [Thermomonospora catenispora]